MHFSASVSVALAAFSTLGHASPLVSRAVPKTDYDVVVVGGGPAGLSALSGLARVRRNTLLIDSAEYRNADTRRVHDVIGLDGQSPALFRYNARQLISKYPTAHMQNGTVTSIVATGNANQTTFLTTDSNNKTYTSRKIVLATGLVDILPDTPGVKEAWARGIFWCPWCDGFEHADQRLGLLGSIVDVVGSVLESINLNKDIIAFVNGTHTPANEAVLDVRRPGWRQQLAGYNVTLNNNTISSIERLQDGAEVYDPVTGAEYDRFLVRLADGSTVERDAFLTNFPNKQRNYLAKTLGAVYYADRINVASSSMKTDAAGVWAIGDNNIDNTTNVPHAMFTGKKAAVYVHVELEREFAAGFVTKRSDAEVEAEVERLMGRDLEDLWDLKQ